MQRNRPGSPGLDPRSQKKPKYEKQEESGGTLAKINLAANFWNMKLKFNTIYQYAVEFEPDVQNIRARRFFLGKHTPEIGGHFLWDKILLTQQDIGTEKTLDTKTDRGESFTIHIRFAKKIDLSDPKEQVQSLKQIFNIQVKSVLSAHNELQQLGKKGMLFERKFHRIRNSALELMLGYQVQVVTLQSGLFLNVGDAMKVIRDQTALEYMKKKGSDSIIGRIVYAQYGRGQTYRVDAVDKTKTPQSTFKQNASKKLNRPEREITYEQYFMETYGSSKFVKITDKRQPLLMVTQRRRDQVLQIHLIPELVTLTGLEDEERMDRNLMKEIAEIAKPNIKQKIDNLNNFSQKYFNPNHSTEKVRDAIKQWGIEIRPKMFEFSGKKFPLEDIYFGENKTIRPSERADWMAFHKDHVKFVNVQSIDRWQVFTPQLYKDSATTLIAELTKTSEDYGLKFKPPLVVIIPDRERYEEVIKSQIKEGCQLAVLILPNKYSEPYNSIKQILTTKFPVPSQCITANLINKKGLKSVCNKLAVQIVAKVGGIPWRFNFKTSEPLMIVGLASAPNPGGDDKHKYVTGVVASYTPDFARYFNVVRPSSEKQISNLGELLQNAIENFKHKNNVKPKHVIIYREGLSDGQIDSLSRWELEQVRKVLDVNFAYVIVTRKTNTKIFHNDNGFWHNPPPGTVVDSHIVRPGETVNQDGISGKRYDFYLISQGTTQGTVSPAHYHVTFDSTTLGNEDIQRLSYKLCHIYYNWSGTIALPAPIVYARKLVQQCGILHGPPSPFLSDKIFYV